MKFIWAFLFGWTYASQGGLWLRTKWAFRATKEALMARRK